MNAFVLVGAIHSIYLAFIVLNKRRPALSDKVLATFFLLIGLSYGLLYTAVEISERNLAVFLWNYSLLICPFFWIYILSLVSPKARVHRYLYYFIPYLLSSTYLLYLNLTYPKRELLAIFLNDSFSEKPFLFLFFWLLDILSLPFFSFLSYRELTKYKHKIKDEFSYTEEINLDWLKGFVILGFAIWLITGLPFFVFPYFLDLGDEATLQVGFVAALPFIFYLGYFGYRQEVIFRRGPKKELVMVEEGTRSQERYRKTGIDEGRRKAIALEVRSLVESEKLYLKSKLAMDDLVAYTDYSKHNISEAINMAFGKTFYEFINEMRVIEFERRVHQGAHHQFTLLSIAYDCGFNSKTSFNRIYKALRGQTPTAFINSVK